MKRMATSSILILGLSGLGIELAKNICLAGVKSVTLSDPTLVTLPDLGTQFFLRASDVGARRDTASHARLAELNKYVQVDVLPGVEANASIPADVLAQFTVVVLVGASTPEQIRLGDECHARGIKYITTSSAGLFASSFCDFGPAFPVIDTTGETPLSGMVVGVESDADEALVTCLDETRHGLEDGDFVRFTEVVGLDINAEGVEGARKVTVKGKLPCFPAVSSTMSAHALSDD